MSLEEEVIKAGEAEQVLDSRIFNEAKMRVKEGILAQMKTVPLADEKMHTKLILALQIWESIESYLHQAVATGKLAKYQLSEEEKRKTFFGMF